MSPCEHTAVKDRLDVRDDARQKEAFARAITRGLATAPRSVDFRWLLDDVGVGLLARLREQPEHYVVAAECQVLADRADALPLYFPNGAPTVIEVGVVDVRRSETLLAPLLRAFETLEYIAVGPHRAAVEPGCRALLGSHAGLGAQAVVGRLEDAITLARQTPGPVLFFFPGAGLGAYERAEAIATLRSVGAALAGRDLLVAGIDLRKDPRAVERCHADRGGFGKRLHLHLVTRLTRDLCADADPALFRHRVVYDAETGRLDAYIVSRRTHSFRIAALDLGIDFGKGEQIHVETATKFSPQEIDLSAKAADLVVHERWYDRDGRICLNLMRPVPNRA